LMVLNNALSTAFWSSALALAIFFGYTHIVSVNKSLACLPSAQALTSGFSPCLKNASSPLPFFTLSFVKYPSPLTFSTTELSTPLKSTFWLVAMT